MVNKSPVAFDGVYNNSSFMNIVPSLIGSFIKVYTTTGVVFIGVFRTFSSQFDIVVDLAHKIDENDPTNIHVESVVDKMIFKTRDVIKIEFIDADMDYSNRDVFQTDAAISKYNMQIGEKQLVPWDGSEDNADECELDDATNGWDVIEMFKRNEEMYGVKSAYDSEMSAYTTALRNKNTKDYKEAAAKAGKIANEIKSNPLSKARIDLENGKEDDKSTNNAFLSAYHPSCEGNKYICHREQKPVHVPNKLIRAEESIPKCSTKSINNSMKLNIDPPIIQPKSSTTKSTISSSDNSTGVIESPKSPRSPVTSRHARSFNAGTMISATNSFVPPVTLNNPGPLSSAVAEPKSSYNQNHNTHSVSNLPSPVEQHQRKPPLLQHPDHQLSPGNFSMPRKMLKERDCHVSDFKKFHHKFKLNETFEDKLSALNSKSEYSVSPTTPNNQTINSGSDICTPLPSSGVSCSEPVDNKPLQSKLNPNAKEFIYNPDFKSFTVRSPSAPGPRPFMPQASRYAGPVPQLQTMVMPSYVLTPARPQYIPMPNPSNCFQKVHLEMPQPIQMQVPAAHRQPLFAPAPMHTQFIVPYMPNF